MPDRPLPRRRPPGTSVPAEGVVDDPRLLQQLLTGLVRAELEACPGDLLVHADGRVECLADPACPTDPALHVGIVHCGDDVEGGCCARTA